MTGTQQGSNPQETLITKLITVGDDGGGGTNDGYSATGIAMGSISPNRNLQSVLIDFLASDTTGTLYLGVNSATVQKQMIRRIIAERSQFPGAFFTFEVADSTFTTGGGQAQWKWTNNARVYVLAGLGNVVSARIFLQ